MSIKSLHIVPYEDQWGVIGEGKISVTFLFNTQKEAINAGRKIAKNLHSELFIHNRKGQIRARDSYGNNPYPPKG